MAITRFGLACLLPVALLVGCGINENNHPEKFAQADCVRYEECFLGAFEEDYTSQDDCRTRNADFYEDIREYAEDADCEYRNDKAKECLASIRQASCEDWSSGDLDGCEQVWHC